MGHYLFTLSSCLRYTPSAVEVVVRAIGARPSAPPLRRLVMNLGIPCLASLSLILLSAGTTPSSPYSLHQRSSIEHERNAAHFAAKKNEGMRSPRTTYDRWTRLQPIPRAMAYSDHRRPSGSTNGTGARATVVRVRPPSEATTEALCIFALVFVVLVFVVVVLFVLFLVMVYTIPVKSSGRQPSGSKETNHVHP